MGAEQIFILACLAQVSGLCLIMERKEKRIQASIKKAEKRRKEHLHDYYCTQEAARLYNMRKGEGV